MRLTFALLPSTDILQTVLLGSSSSFLIRRPNHLNFDLRITSVIPSSPNFLLTSFFLRWSPSDIPVVLSQHSHFSSFTFPLFSFLQRYTCFFLWILLPCSLVPSLPPSLPLSLLIYRGVRFCMDLFHLTSPSPHPTTSIFFIPTLPLSCFLPLDAKPLRGIWES